jgi:hypothetical protein
MLASAPWCAHSVDARAAVNSHIPTLQHVIIFHLLTQGRGLPPKGTTGSFH